MNLENESPLLRKEGSGVVAALKVELQVKKLAHYPFLTTPKSLRGNRFARSPSLEKEGTFRFIKSKVITSDSR